MKEAWRQTASPLPQRAGEAIVNSGQASYMSWGCLPAYGEINLRGG